jgi:hypothetical protein
MTITSFNFTIDHRTLIDIKTLINTPPLVKMEELEGMFWRGEDFSQSYANLTQQYMDEFKLANEAFPKSKDVHELHGHVAGNTRPNTTGDNHFTTYSLSPLIRHFLNDICRLLEPTTPQFVRKHAGLKFSKSKSLGSYVSEVQKSGKTLSFDAQFIVELYELWNDYKHRSTKGLHATAWKYEDKTVVEPKLGLPSSGFDFKKLATPTVFEFVQQTNTVVLEYLKDTYSGLNTE